jgi:thymidylate synthase (FAD)
LIRETSLDDGRLTEGTTKIIEPGYEILYPTSLDQGTGIVKDIERAARLCYKSELSITDTSYVTIVRSLIARKHDAMLEFGDISVLLSVNRGVTHELVRHRMASFAQESTRYCNYGKGKFGNEITVIGNRFLATAEQVLEWETAMCDAEKHYLRLLDLGCSPQIARDVLPNATKADIIIKANVREWRHIFNLRISSQAHPQMREIMDALLSKIKELVPVVFDDIEHA